MRQHCYSFEGSAEYDFAKYVQSHGGSQNVSIKIIADCSLISEDARYDLERTEMVAAGGFKSEFSLNMQEGNYSRFYPVRIKMKSIFF